MHDGAVLILVPAPMTKTPSAAGPPVDLDALSFPELNPQRIEVMDAAFPTLRVAPTTPARSLYGGPLLRTAFDGLEPDGRARAEADLLYVSAIWGLVRPSDELPNYRAHMCDRPPGVGHLVDYWQPHLASVLPRVASDQLVVDFRAAEYLQAWRPSDPARWVTIKPVRDEHFERGSGGTATRMVRGLVLRRILTDGGAATDPEGLAAALDPWFRVQLRPPSGASRSWELRVRQPD